MHHPTTMGTGKGVALLINVWANQRGITKMLHLLFRVLEVYVSLASIASRLDLHT
jgi:hypothetical protein